MLIVVRWYRTSRLCSRWHVPVVPKLIDYAIRLVFSCWLPHGVRAGSKLVLGYGGLGVIIHSDVEIGDNVHIDQGVTIGGNGTTYGVPCIESNVYIGAGAKILGPIRIGEGSIIGANAVVIRDVPPRSLSVGVPAKVIQSDINIETFLYHNRN
mgnify:CR=1 FL=1